MRFPLRRRASGIGAVAVDAPRAGFARAEWKVLLLCMAVQFINITESVMLVPMGPQLAEGLRISITHLGYINGSYLLAACTTGLINSLFLDRFDRRKALGVCATGLAVGTILGAMSVDLVTMMMARIVAGIFGGTCSALSLALIADAIPPERRGRAIGAASASFTAATVFGIPIGFELAVWGGWRMPFFAVGGLGFLVAGGVYAMLPRQSGGKRARGVPARAALGELGGMLRRPTVLLALGTMLSNVLPGGLIVPVLAPYFTHNLHYPEQSLGVLWAAGGVFGLVTGNLAGWLVDRFGPLVPAIGISLAMAAHWTLLFLLFRPGWPLMPMFGFYVGLNIARLTVGSTVMTRVTPSAERGRFLSLTSVVQSGGIGLGSFCTAAILVEAPDGHLANIPHIVGAAFVFMALTPVLIAILSRRLRAQPAVAETHLADDPVTVLAAD